MPQFIRSAAVERDKMKGISAIKNFFKGLPQKIKGIPSRLSARFAGAKEILTQGNGKVTASMLVIDRKSVV